MLFDGIECPVSRRLWWFQRRIYFRRAAGGIEPSWIAEQEDGIGALATGDCNNDSPCRYARSRGE